MESGILQLAHDLEWLARSLPHSTPAKAGTDSVAYLADDLLPNHRRSIISTADKIARELLGTVRFDPTRLMGVGCPIEDTLDSMAELIKALEDIKQDAVSDPAELPVRIRSFNQMIEEYLDGSLPTAA